MELLDHLRDERELGGIVCGVDDGCHDDGYDGGESDGSKLHRWRE